MFCEKCRKILKIENKGICSCGFANIIKEVGYTENKKEKKEIGKGAAEKDETLGAFPHLCSKCGHDMAEVKELGVFYGDEAGVYLFKCKKCGYTERQADGTGNA